MDFVFELLGAVMDFKLLAYVFIGTFFGIVAGAIPGFTILMAVILVFPFTFSMSPLEGLSTMIGVYVGGGAGGQVSGVLLGIPGTPSSICTVFDGYPLAQKGKAGLALGLGIFGSFFGGLIGVLSLVLLLKPAAEFGLKFGPWEMFSLVLFSLTLIASLGEKSFLKGLIGGAFGLILATIGIDDTGGTLCFTFGMPSLTTGITLLPTLVGLFAFPHLLKGVEQRRQLQHAGDQQSMLGDQNLNIPYREVFGCLKKYWGCVLRSGAIGAFVGALPGEGGTVANFLSYDQAKRASKTPELFGEGTPEGVIASEAGNSGTAGGSMIPTLALGVPGSATAAVMMGVLMVHSIPPGPGLFKNEPILVFGLFLTFFIAHFFMVFIQCAAGGRFFLKVAALPMPVLIPIVFMLCAIGSYSLNNQISDVWLFFVFGIIGYLLDKADYPLPPIVIGLILGEMFESNLRQALTSDPDWTLFFTRPISGVFMALTAVSILLTVRQIRKHRKGLKSMLDK